LLLPAYKDRFTEKVKLGLRMQAIKKGEGSLQWGEFPPDKNFLLFSPRKHFPHFHASFRFKNFNVLGILIIRAILLFEKQSHFLNF